MMISKSILFQSICVAVLAVVSAAGITLELDTIQVGLTDTVTTLRDNGTASVGDIYTWNTGNKIYATADPTALNGSPVVGENQGHCVRLTNAGADSMWDCTITIFLYDGQLECHGPFSTNTTQCVITGGSGKYQGAVGFMELSYAGTIINSYAGTYDTNLTLDANGSLNAYHYNFKMEVPDNWWQRAGCQLFG